jgi:hypothetical protein
LIKFTWYNGVLLDLYWLRDESQGQALLRQSRALVEALLEENHVGHGLGVAREVVTKFIFQILVHYEMKMWQEK